ncbi:MAG: response regulator [Deltaproteobacteria bacterium]
MSQPPILVVEDNPLTRKMLRITLESEGYRVVEAADGRTALAALAQEKPALVLQDLILPDMNGFELLRQLRQLGGEATPIIALTGFLSRIEEARGAEVGFTALLLKPVEPSHLVEFIWPYLPNDAVPLPYAQGCLVLVVDDDLVQLKLTRLHLTQLGFEVLQAASSSEALRTARAQRPDVVLADVLMPDVDGFQLCFQVRKDPALCRLPVILASAWYETAADRELACRVGANALVRKTPDLQGVPEAIRAAVKQGAPRLTEELDSSVRLDHAQAVIRQLQRQVNLRSDLARRCTLQAAQISLLSGIADALAVNTDADAALRDVLAATLDAAGISKGALFLQAEGGGLALRHAIGFTASEQAGLIGFFGHAGILQDAVQRQATLSIPSAPVPEGLSREILAQVDTASAQVVPLISDGRGVGAMLLCAKHTDVTNDDSIAFARAMGNQLAQSLELAKSFARLTASERRYRAVTEAAREAISILAPDGIIQECNPSFAAALGLPRGSIIGHRISDFAPVGQEQGSGKSPDWAQDADVGPAPVALLKSDGSIVLMEFTSRSVDLGAEKFSVSIGRDVTERVKTQAQLMFSDRMVSIGSLAAGVAHEINNPLTATVANLEFALERVAELAKKHGADQVADLDELLRDASAGAQSVRTIVRDLKIFSRAEEDHRGPVDLQRVLESSIRMAWNEIRHRAQLVREYESIPAVEANESRLGQVFLNLIVNAVQALPDGYADKNRIWIRTRVEPSGRVVAEVEDTGPGIPQEVLRRLFTPFFTTKARGVGTGLGLSICQRIVTSFGGEITVDSVVGRGTRFSVSLLGSQRSADASFTTPLRVTSAGRRGRVLVVDDDAMSATAISRGLSPEHDVVLSDAADAALGRILHGERFDAIICDLMMPIKTGVEFFAEVSAQAPELAARIIFLTGGAFTVKAREFLDRVANPRLEKPFDLPALRALVNAQLR